MPGRCITSPVMATVCAINGQSFSLLFAAKPTADLVDLAVAGAEYPRDSLPI